MTSMLSFKLVDLVNDALDEGTYYKSKVWYLKNEEKMKQHHLLDWNKKLSQAFLDLRALEKESPSSKIKPQSEQFTLIVKFFNKLKSQYPAMK